MSDEQRDPSGVSRRALISGATANLASACAPTETPQAQNAGSGGGVSVTAAGYYYSGYGSNFAVNYFDKNHIVGTVQNIKSIWPNEATLEWGRYQKHANAAAGTALGWGSDWSTARWMFENWEAAIDEARRDLRKLPPPNASYDPYDNSLRANNLLDHLDKAVRIALYREYMPGNKAKALSGIPIDVRVNYKSRQNRRHTVSTVWNFDTSVNPPVLGSLTINMECPFGGWVAYTSWENKSNTSKIQEFSADIVVPSSPPQNDGQVVFVFHGLEGIPGRSREPAIIQPVLQWKYDPSGGSGWSVRGWYVPAGYEPEPSQLPALDNERTPQWYQDNTNKPWDPSKPLWTRAVVVQPNDRLHGVISKTSSGYACWFNINGSAMQTAYLNVNNLDEMTFAVATIEAYKISAADPKDNIKKNGYPQHIEMSPLNFVFSGGNPAPSELVWYEGSPAKIEHGVQKFSTKKLQIYDISISYLNTYHTSSSLIFDYNR